jgi:hypothetical protein
LSILKDERRKLSIRVYCPFILDIRELRDSNRTGIEREVMTSSSFAGKVNAPEFPPGLEWVNTDRPLTLRELRGKIVLLDFWTYC